MIWTLITAAVSYWLGEGEGAEKANRADLAAAERRAGVSAPTSPPTTAQQAPPNTDVNALPTGDVGPTRSTP